MKSLCVSGNKAHSEEEGERFHGNEQQYVLNVHVLNPFEILTTASE